MKFTLYTAKIPGRNECRVYATFTDPAGQTVTIQSPAAPFNREAFWRTVLTDKAARYMDGKIEGLIPLVGDMAGAVAGETRFAYAG
jgi:hypothetical protein